MSKKLEELLCRQPKAPILPFDPDREECVLFNFTEDNPELQGIDPADTAGFTDYVFGKMRQAGSRIGLGGYKENRSIYRHSGLFAKGKVRSFHLGIDLWVESGTPVLTPYDGQVHSFQENQEIGDYGPTIILSHTLEGVEFYTLYGHLSRESLSWPAPGQAVTAGQKIAEVGDSTVNGNWPPHLHFEVIEDLGGRSGDFPGVCAPKDREEFLKVCPDPNFVLKLQALGRPAP